jgi:hypothetical protein
VAANYCYNFRRTLPAGFSVSHFARLNLFRPFVLVLPQLGVLVAAWLLGLPLWGSVPLLALATVPALKHLVQMRRQLKAAPAV